MRTPKIHFLRDWILYSALLFLTGVVLSGVAAYFQYRLIDTNARSEFERLASRTETEVSARLEKVVYALRGARGLFAAADHEIRHGEFLQFVLSRDLQKEFPGVRGFGYIQRVERTDLPGFIAAQKADGAPDFAVQALVDKHFLDLFVVKFIEPAANNRGALGLDLGSEAIRRAAIQQAINTGADTVTGAITLVQDDRKLAGLLLYVPVYRSGAPIDVPKERRAALQGVLYSPIVMSEILSDMPDVQSGMLRFQITDASINATGGAVLFTAQDQSSRLHAGDNADMGGRFSLRKPLQLPGRSVTLSMSSTRAFDASINQTTPYLLFGSGVLISALLALAMYQQASARLHAENLARDMTKDLKYALRDNEALLTTLNLHAIVSISDRSGRIIEANDAFCKISGYSRSELLGQDHRIINSHVQPHAFWVDVWKTIASGVPWRGQVCNRAKDGQFYWVDTLIAPFMGDDQKIEKYISIRTNITAIKKAEEELRWSQSLMDKMSNSSPLAFLVVDDRTDEVLYINHRCYEIWGVEHLGDRIPHKALSNSELVAACLTQLVHAQAYAQSCEALQSQDNRITVEDELAFADGRTVRRFSTQIRDAQDQYYGRFSIFEDITARKAAERALTDATQAAQAASLSKSQFLANMSHEIRTPMNAILGLLNLLQTTELTTQQRDYATKTEGAAKSLLGLLNDILDFSKAEAGKMTLESEPFRIDELLRSLSVVLSSNAGAKNMDVLFDVDASLPEVVRGDAMRLQQVLINLGGNAVKFTSEGHVVIRLRKLAQTESHVTIAFAVEDTGIGIAPEHQAHIFDGFSQAEGSTTRRFGGTGLGLTISKRLVELMGGTIQVQSVPGVGSTFGFVLEMPTAAVVPDALAQHQTPCLEPRHVLIVDDNPIFGELTLGMVRAWGWSAELATSGAAAVDLVARKCTAEPSEFPYPVIYTDWRLPDMDGWETVRRIRQIARSQRLAQPTVIMVTAHGRDMLAQRSQEEQDLLNGFMVKPVTSSMMYEALSDALSGAGNLHHMTQGRSNLRQLSGMRILVVEDNLINQQVADELLSAAGAIVSLAANGRLGVDAVAAAAPQFDVVLMDLQMPVLDGYGATRSIREELGLTRLPIIAMTANAMASDRDVCLAAGMDEHIGKPFDMDKLVSLLLRITRFEARTEPSLAASDRGSMPALPDIEGLDLASAVGRMAGMRSLYLRTARDFIRILDTAAPELQSSLSADRAQAASMHLHTLKGNAATLGANDLAAMAAKMETLSKSEAGMQACLQKLPEFEEQVRRTQALLQTAVARMESANSAAVGTTADAPHVAAAHAALRKLTELAGSNDLQALQYFAEERATLDALPGDWIEQLEEALQNLDLDATHALGQSFIATGQAQAH